MKKIPSAPDIWVNDIHSSLNRTRVHKVVAPQSIGELAETIKIAARDNRVVSVSGCRHAMGGQQFRTNGIVLDMRQLKRVIHFDRERGLLRAEAGIQWPDLIKAYLAKQNGNGIQWGIAQKQTGADTFTLGGSISANTHGRGLTLGPLIRDVESCTLLKADGQMVACSRQENSELFSLVIGGYGLLGVVVDVTLRLIPRQKLERVVKIETSDVLDERFRQRIEDGFLYGDFQFSIDESSPSFLKKGVFSCYRPTDKPVPANTPRELNEKNWIQLLYLAYTDRTAAYEKYVDYYLSTNGQTYWSDTHQLGPYLPDYAQRIQQMGGISTPSSLVITELYVPRQNLANFLQDAAQTLRELGVKVIYGTVRLIEKDEESFLAWAKESYACVIFNLLMEHSSEEMNRATNAFQILIDLAANLGGSYFLTYHRFATFSQLKRCYPQFDRFLELKKKYDPKELFQSDWYCHYRSLC